MTDQAYLNLERDPTPRLTPTTPYTSLGHSQTYSIRPGDDAGKQGIWFNTPYALNYSRTQVGLKFNIGKRLDSVKVLAILSETMSNIPVVDNPGARRHQLGCGCRVHQTPATNRI